ncbi:MAG TPA: TetR/AcrR family transcriptional regulator [Jatrophihabitans sp.]|nr:TetR/AcrR family transcriptional regulator [Jatrophihabitans sp.]
MAIPVVSTASPAAGRAAPMSRDDRRAAIVAATLPLLRAHGHAVTTRQIAEASGIGEGTIFRVFTDKAELVDACLAAAFDQSDTVARFAAIDRGLPLESRLVEAVTVLQHRLQSVVELLLALGLPRPPDQHTRPDPRADRGHDQLLDGLAELLEPDRARLRTSPAETARAVRLLTFAASHPRITDGNPMSPHEIVTLLLHGMLRAEHEGGSAC